MSDYTTVLGTVQFDPTEKDVSGKPVREVLIRSVKDGENVRCTVWDSWPKATTPINKGDVIIADGKASVNVVAKDDGTSVTYRNLSVTTLTVIPQAPKSETTTTVNKPASTTTSVF